jgi:hypothetical protein
MSADVVSLADRGCPLIVSRPRPRAATRRLGGERLELPLSRYRPRRRRHHCPAAAPVAALVTAAPVPPALVVPALVAPVIAPTCLTSVVRASPVRASALMPTVVAPGIDRPVAPLVDVQEEAADRADDKWEDTDGEDGASHRSVPRWCRWWPPDQYGHWSPGFQGVPEPARSWLLRPALVARVSRFPDGRRAAAERLPTPSTARTRRSGTPACGCCSWSTSAALGGASRPGRARFRLSRQSSTNKATMIPTMMATTTMGSIGPSL